MVGLALAAPFFAGCVLWKSVRDQPSVPPALPDQKANVPALVNYLNLNARKVQSVRAKVDMDCKAEGRAFGLSGAMACQKPRDFRLRGSVLGKPAVDIGSNNDEFWYWISQATPPYVYHCSYRDLATGKVPVPFPFQPEMVMAAMGIAEYDDKAKYELREHTKPAVLELVQEATSPSGQPVKRITIFNRYAVQRAGEPQVLAHVLQDANGKLICRATVQKVMADPRSGATVPTKVKLEWPEQRLEMTMMLTDVQANVLDPAASARLFGRGDLTGHQAFDLARGVVDTPGGVHRAGASELPRR
jgi:hypothetical protein